jgi:hypothetical protein
MTSDLTDPRSTPKLLGKAIRLKQTGNEAL